MSSLPANKPSDSADQVRRFFDTYNKASLSYNANEVSAVIGYFLKRGFDEIAAINTAGVLLNQAKKDNISAQKLIDTLDGFTDVKLSNAVSTILNINRPRTSQLGYKTEFGGLKYEQRNIMP